MLENWLKKWLDIWPDGRSFRTLTDLGIVVGTDRGPVRNENQDRVAVIRYTGPTIQKSFLCAVVSDGMGGMREGAKCASTAIAAFLNKLIESRDHFSIGENLDSAARAANESVYKFAKGTGGATLSAVLITGNGQASWINVGDSRVYSFANSSTRTGQLQRLTVDDNLEEAFGGHGRELVQFVGIGRGIVPHIGNIARQPLSLLITTDGIHSVDELLFRTIYEQAPNYRSGAERLLAASNWVSGSDNGTIVGISIPEALASISTSVNEVLVEFWKPGDNSQVIIPFISNDIPVQKRSDDNLTVNQTARQKSKKPKKSKKKQVEEQLEIDVNYARKPHSDNNR